LRLAAIDQQRQPLGERHGVDLGLLELGPEGLGHGREAQGMKLLDRRLMHGGAFLQW